MLQEEVRAGWRLENKVTTLWREADWEHQVTGEESVAALSTEVVLAEEAAAIHGKSVHPDASATGLSHHRRGVKPGVGDDDAHNCEETGKHQREFYHKLNELDSAALCLSGGGIRSAAFSLGVIQALASQQMGAGAAPPPA